MVHFISSNDETLSRSEKQADRKTKPLKIGMKNRRRRGSAGTAKTVGSQLLGLSLFIMLLAFFIVLNAISSYEDVKVRPVMASLSYAFASRMLEQRVDENPSVTQSQEDSIHEGDTLERLKALFTAQIPSSEVAVSSHRGVMYVKLPFDDFEAAVMAVGQRNALNQQQESAQFLKGFFLPTLVALMKTDKAGMPYRMDMLLNIDNNPAQMQNRQPKQMVTLIKDMGRIAAKLEDSGLSTKLVSGGLQKGEPGTIELMFRRHVPFNPLGDQPAEGQNEQQ